MTTSADDGSVPGLSDAADFCAGVSAVVSEAARLPMLGQAGEEIAAHDARLSDDDVPNPVKFAHEVGGMYLLAAGDFINCLQYAVQPSANLRFSAASLSRSACEYSVLCWKLSLDSYSVDERLRYTFADFRSALRNPSTDVEFGTATVEILARCERWIARQSFEVPGGLAKFGDLQEEMFPEVGKNQYRVLSGKTHGRATSMLRGVVENMATEEERRFESWAEILIGTARGLAAAQTVSILRGGLPSYLPDLWMLHRHYSDAAGLSQLLGNPDSE